MSRSELTGDLTALYAVRDVLRSYSRPWWIAGGWALDLHLDSDPRPHHDVDVAVLRPDQHHLQRHLSGWSTRKVVNSERVPWRTGEPLLLPVHELHAERDGEHLEFLLNEVAADRWLFRRNPSVSLPLAELGRCSSDGIPYLCPQVVLLFKAKNPRPVDEIDFDRALPTLRGEEKQWLRCALEVCHPEHPWIERLSASGGSASAHR